jgi:hypothetical protein
VSERAVGGSFKYDIRHSFTTTMARRKPVSGKQHKAKLQLKRAVKRGDVPPPDPALKKPTRRKPRPGSAPTSNAALSSKRLQSAFMKLPSKFLEESKTLAASLILPRPIPLQATILDELRNDVSDSQVRALICPRRPKWNYDMTKKDVEKNEEGVFKKWLAATDALVAEWQVGKKGVEGKAEGAEPRHRTTEMPRSPTYFERNLEVWRQLCVILSVFIAANTSQLACDRNSPDYSCPA